MWIATSDGVLRTQKCERLKEASREVRLLTDEYFEKPIHNGLASFITNVVHDQEFAYSAGGEVGSKIIVMTYATVHTDINKCLDDTTTTYQLERLGAYKSEKQLEDRIHHFFFSSSNELLVLQCKPELDGEHMLLARSIIEDKRNAYEKTYQPPDQRKHVCILVHVRRGANPKTMHWQFNFLCGWKQVFLDVLDEPPVPMNKIRSETIDKLLMLSNWSFRRFAKDSKCLLWCFNCIKYIKDPRSLDNILDIAKRLFESEKVYNTIQKLVMKYVNTVTAEEKNESWPVKVACDRASLINSSTFSSAIEHYLSRLVREPLTKIIYFLEQENAWPPHILLPDENSLPKCEDVWCDLIRKDTIFNIFKIPAPLGAESYIVDGVRLNLSVPFSQVIIRRVNAAKELVLKEYNLYLDENEGEEHNQETQGKQIQHYSEIVSSLVPDTLDLPEWYFNLYTDDFLDVTLAFFCDNIKRQQRVSIGNCAFLSFAKEDGFSITDPLQRCVQFHLFVWNFGQQIIDQVRMINSCKQFVNPTVVDTQIRKFLQKCQPALDLRQTEYKAYSPKVNENDNVISMDEADMTIREESESSKEFGPCLKRKSEQFQQHEHCNRDDDLPSKKSRHEMEPKSESEGNDSDTSNEEDSGSDDSESSSNEDSESSSSEDESDANLPSCEENEVLEERFEDILVTAFCEEMFPSERTFTKNGGLESWIRNVSLLLSLAFKVSNQTPAFHFLRLCVDYAKMVVQTVGISEHYLYDLEKIARELKPKYLDTDGSLQKLTKMLVDPLENQLMDGEEKYVVIQKFLAKIYSRCIDTYEDTQSAVPIVKNVFSLDREDLVLLMKPVIYSLLHPNQTESTVIFLDLIIDRSALNNCPCLKSIDEVFKERFAKGLIHHDSYPAVLICDIICSILKSDQRFVIEQLTNSECELLTCLRCATKVLNELNGREEYVGLVLLSSVAFLRVFYTMLSEYPDLLKIETRYTNIMAEINSLLALGGSRNFSLQHFFLKQLYGADISMFDLRKLCEESDKLPAIKCSFQTSKIVNKVELVSVYRLPEYEEVKAAYWKLTQQKEDDMLTILTKCQISANHRLALLGILINMFYVKKAFGNLSEKEERLAHWFSVKSKNLPFSLKELLLRIIGHTPFDHRGLQISLESSTNEVEIALLILHVSCVVASRVEGEISPLFQYFSNPSKCHDTWIPAHDKGRLYRVFDQRKFPNDLTLATCCCGVRIKFLDNSQHNKCPFCLRDFARPDVTSIPSNKKFCLDTKLTDWDKRSENMDIFTFRAVHLIVHACLYAGVAMGISSNDDLALFCTEQQSFKYSAESCLDAVKDDLHCLKTILSCKSRTAVDVMHLVVEECTELIRGKIFSKDIFSTREECLEWENIFTNVSKELLSKALGSARPLKQIRMKSNDENEERPLIENKIQELDEYPSDLEQQNEELRRLFRVTKQPSFTEVRSIFLNSSKDFQDQHSVLELLLSRFDELPYLTCLFPLLRWTRLVSSALTLRISRKEVQAKYINYFIEGQMPGQERNDNEVEELRSNSNEFLDAWNKMRDFVNQELPEDQEEMPYLMEHDCKLGYCLTEGDLSIYLCTAIKILQSIQNSILDEMILTSTCTRHPALSFLEKNDTCCAIMSVSLEEAKEKDIINFDWPDEFLKYAQKLEYGLGEEIDYDFERMEKELADEIAFGKCYLTESLNRFIFSKELFHSSAQMLTRIRQLYPQSQSLPEEISLRIQDAPNLLQNIEVVIFLLNMQSVPIQQEMTLEEFADKWKTKLPSPFPVDLLPEPRTSIKLTHIAALYEALEDLLADGTIGGLPRQFQAKLTDETKRSLNCLVDSRNGSIKLKQFLTALRRFVFRYISAEKFLPEPHTSLRSTLNEPSLWSPDEAPGPSVIPREMTLANIHAIITHLEQEQKGHSSALGGISSHKRLSKKPRRHGRNVSRS